MSGGVWMVSEGVWMMSEWCLRVSGEASILNLLAKIILGHDTQVLLFFQCLYCKKCLCLGVSRLCLGGSVGVWIISGGVWHISGGV